MPVAVRDAAALALALVTAALVRLPFWREALRTPVDGDTAIIGLMARHPFRGLTMWGQPYGSPLEPWIAAPALAVLGATPEALRIAYFALGLALVPAAWALGRALERRLALPLALLAVVPPPYFLLLSAMPPPMYPGALVLALALLARALARPPRRTAARVAWGLLAGITLWTHLMTASVLVPAAAWIAWAAAPEAAGRDGARGPRLRAAATLLVAILLGSAPWWTRAVADRQAAAVVGVSGRRATMGEHLATTLPALHRPLGGVIGTHTPLVADDAVHLARPPFAVAALLAAAWLALLALAAGRRGDARTRVLLAVASLAVLAFPFPLRSGPAAIRFLTPLVFPLAAAGLFALLRKRGPAWTWAAAALLAVLHGLAARPLLAAWRSADREAPPFLLPDLAPARRLLESRGLTRAYASYGPAYRLTFESGERIVASQPWNERFLHQPLPYLDEVRFAHGVAWVLTPDVPTDLPSPRAFEEALGRIGGTWRRETAGRAVVYDRFAPPFGPGAEPAAPAGPAGDGDPRTVLAPDARQPVVVDLGSPRPLDALTLVSGAGTPRLPRSMDVEASADGAAFEVVASRRRRGEREDLRWVNGHPQYVIDHDVLSVALGGRSVRAIRITPVASGDPWTLAEVLLHPAGASRPWDEWLDPRLDWPARRAALEAGRRPRADWYARWLLATRAEP